MKTILKHLGKKEIFAFIALVIFTLAEVYGSVTLPSYMSSITTLIKTPGVTMDKVWIEGLWMLLCAFGVLIASVLSFYFATVISVNLCQKLRTSIFAKTMHFSLKETGEIGTSSLITRCTTDVSNIETFVNNGLVMLLLAPITVIGVIIKIVKSDFRWTVTTLVIVVLMLVVLIFICIRVVKYINNIQNTNDDLTRVNREHLSGIRVIHAYNAYDHQKKRFDESNKSYTKNYIKMTNLMAFLLPLVTGMYNLLTVLIYVIGAAILSNNYSGDKLALYSDMVAFSSYASQILIAVTYLVLVAVLLPKTISSVRRVSEVLNKEISIVDSKDPQKAKEKGTIEFRDVSFRYPGTKTDSLSHLNFTVKN